jgi:hypothetical protein
MKWAALTIENAWINMSIIRNARKLVYNKKLDKCARVIQGLWRKRVARVRVRLMFEHRLRSKNALKIQCLYRGYCTRCLVYDADQAKIKYRSALKIQNAARMFLAYQYVRAKREQNKGRAGRQKLVTGGAQTAAEAGTWRGCRGGDPPPVKPVAPGPQSMHTGAPN